MAIDARRSDMAVPTIGRIAPERLHVRTEGRKSRLPWVESVAACLTPVVGEA
jgi:hypothetical protein